MAVKPPRWYFSLRSPYSWLAFRELTENHPDVADTIEWRPCWEPAEATRKLLDEAGIRLPYVHMSKEKHLYILQDIKRLAAASGLTVGWPIDTDPNWDIAHLAYFVADDLGRGRDFIRLVYQARWQRGLNISDPAVIAGVGERLGLDGEALAGAADDPDIRARGVEALRAADRDGAFGVPFFVHRHDKFWGSDRLPGFIEAVREGVAAKVPAPRTAAADDIPAHALAPAGDQGHAGGCG
ncbi:2-hydroxychromene-2-carboxylate isomerase [Streptomyces violaceusniger]|uniref:2-hydroxychromene-2-carboxylate isomerase n=1 Tax=Streptomyces violaceusniger TaxID=68280 RepID=A0A4D4L0C0_STRVO|nr:2-hydroxychromene-2-carboxylate isomerase [Streptomyces violaceusniger]